VEADFLSIQRQSLRAVASAIRARRDHLAAISLALGANWRHLNAVVALSCLQSLVLGVLLVKHRTRVRQLREALGSIKTLSGLLPICSSCKKIRDNRGYWSEVEKYVTGHSDVTFSHGVCEECARKLYPEFYSAMFPEEK
jgi:hypothetical protein